MKKKNGRAFSVYFTKRTLYLLGLCGYIDRRNNTVARGRNLNDFINAAVNDYLIKGYQKEHPERIVFENFFKGEMRRLQREREKIDTEMDRLAEKICTLRQEKKEEVIKQTSRKKSAPDTVSEFEKIYR